MPFVHTVCLPADLTDCVSYLYAQFPSFHLRGTVKKGRGTLSKLPRLHHQTQTQGHPSRAVWPLLYKVALQEGGFD